MRRLRVLAQRLRSLFRTAAVDADLDRELKNHLEALTEENVASGMNAKEARLAALRSLGNPGLLAEECRDQRRMGWALDLRRDFAFAWRLVRKSPGFSAIAVLTLALGIGGSLGVLAIGEALVFRSLPFREPDRLVFLSAIHVTRGEAGVGQQDFRDWQAANSVFEHMGYSEFSQNTLTRTGDPELITGTAVSSGYFEVFDVQPMLGRWFLPAEMEPGAACSVLLSHRLWRRKFSDRSDTVGSTLWLDGKPCLVVGVMPEMFRVIDGRVAEFWKPIGYRNSGRTQHQYAAYARLRAGVTVEAAQQQMVAIARHLEMAHRDTNEGWGVSVRGLRAILLSHVGPALAVFAVAASIVLLIASANVAALLLARSVTRRREIAARVAIGAGRGRILRLLIAEALLLSVCGASFGLMIAAWLVRLATAVAPPWLHLREAIAVSPLAVLSAAGVVLAATLLSGVWPALRSCRVDLHADLKDGTASSTGARGESRALKTAVVAEVALATILVMFAGLLIKSFDSLLATDLGFRVDRLISFRLVLPGSRYPDHAAELAFYDRLLARASALPGVIAAAAADAIPLSGSYSGEDVEVEAQSNSSDWAERSVRFGSVTPAYFQVLGVNVVAGRSFTATDGKDAERVTIVNRAFVNKYVADGRPLGRRLRVGGGEWRTIVGVVADIRHSGPSQFPEPETYIPFAQDGWASFVVIRTAGSAEPLLASLGPVVRSLDSELAITSLRTMDDALGEDTAMVRNLMKLVIGFALIALSISMVGLAGVMAYVVSRRTREIGVRIALGADEKAIARAFLADGSRLVLGGLAIGLAFGTAATRILQSLLFGVRASDPAVIAAASLLVLGVGFAACLLPALRAASVSPLIAIRQD